MANYEQKIVYGMDNIHVAKQKEDGYDVPVEILGAKSVECSFESETKDISADNKVVASITKSSKGEGKLTILGLSSTEKALLLGKENIKGGTVIGGKAKQPHFALLFRQDKADDGNVLTVLYDVQFKESSINAVTTEDGSIEEQNIEIEFTALEKEIEGDSIFGYAVDTTDSSADQTAVSNFFTEVQLPKKK